jgi:hypothetical protein
MGLDDAGESIPEVVGENDVVEEMLQGSEPSFVADLLWKFVYFIVFVHVLFFFTGMFTNDYGPRPLTKKELAQAARKEAKKSKKAK